jgi:hypothetical protein
MKSFIALSCREFHFLSPLFCLHGQGYVQVRVFLKGFDFYLARIENSALFGSKKIIKQKNM